MIGAVDEHEKVIKLWNGLRSSIQQGLWQGQLNPVTSTWEEVADHASILEIVHGISEPNDEGSDAEYYSPAKYNSGSECHSDAEYTKHGSDAENNSTAEYNNDSEYHSNSEYHSDAEYSSDAEYHSDAKSGSDTEYGPNPLGDNQLGNFHRESRGFQSKRSGSQISHRNSSEQSQPPRDNGHFSASRNSVSPNITEFGNQASSHGNSSSWFTPKPFEKLKSNINKEERAELLASGKCFTCKEAGHIASNCPKSNTMRPSSSSPPEVPSFNIGLDWLNEEDSDEVENLSTLQVFGIDILPAEILPEEKNIETCLGDHHEREKLIRVNATQVPDGACPARHRKLQAPRKWPEIAKVGQPEPPAPKMTSCFTFRGPRQRKEGEGEQEIPEIDRYPKTVTRSMENIRNEDPQMFLGSVSAPPPQNEAPFESNFLFSSLSRLGLLYFWLLPSFVPIYFATLYIFCPDS